MTRLIVSTNHREVLHGEVSGWLYVIDLESCKILQTSAGIEPPNRIHDINPRGGMRGMRGVGICNGELAVANYSSVFFFDRHWRLLRVFTHPAVAGIHEILYVEDGLWVTSCYNDLLLKFDLAGNVAEYFYTRSKSLMNLLGGRTRVLLHSDDIRSGKLDFRDRTNFNMNFYDGTHLNSVCGTPGGGLYLSLGLVTGEKFAILQDIKSWMLHKRLWDPFVTLNRSLRRLLGFSKSMFSELVIQPAKGSSAIVKLAAQGEPNVFLALPHVNNPSHTIRFFGDGTGIYLNTSHGSLIHFDEQGRVISQTKVTEKFLRGALPLPDGRLALGASNTMLIFELETRRVVDTIELSNDASISVFDIKVIPDEFDMPPQSLEKEVGRIARFEGRNIIWEDKASANPDSHS